MVPEQYEHVPPASEIQYQPFSQYPFVTRDIALWVTNERTSSEVESIIQSAAGDLLIRITLFDEFEKDGRKSYAFRLVFQSHEKTLTGDVVDEYMNSVYKTVEKEGWEVR